MRIRTGWLIAASLLLGSAVRAEDCALGKQYLSQAQERIASSQRAGAVGLLRQSIAACPSYDAHEALGEQLGHSRNRRDWSGAASEFVEADALAPTPKARAETLYQYASLLNDDQDPQNAYPLVKKAHALDPGRADIVKLSLVVEKQVRVPKRAQLMRSFGLSVYKPLRSASAGGSETISGTDHRQVNIPIHFEFNSVELSEETRGNVAVLADTLNDPSLGKVKFVFIGHSDARGDERYNTDLSRRRADAMRSAVLQLQPSLAGRIEVEGRGSSEPIDNGTNLQAMRANRRLQVIEQ
jgi:outer membrane protein OmpA-like peptidoglycan-associated protein